MADLILFVPGPLVREVHLQLQAIRASVYETEIALSGMADDWLPFDVMAKLYAAEDTLHKITGPIKGASKRAAAAREVAAMQSEIEPEEPTDEQSDPDPC